MLTECSKGFSLLIFTLSWQSELEKLYLADKVDLGDVQANLLDRKFIEK